MTISQIYVRLQLLNSVPTFGLPGSALAEVYLLRARHARIVDDYQKLMEEAEAQMREEEKYAPLKEKEAEDYRNKLTGYYEGIEVKEDDSEETRGLKELMKEYNDARLKMRRDAAEEDSHKAIGFLTEPTYAAICEAAMAKGAVPGMPDDEGKRPDVPAEIFLAELATIIEADSKQKK